MTWGRVVLRVEAPAPVVMLGMALVGLYGAWKAYKGLNEASAPEYTLTTLDAFTAFPEEGTDEGTDDDLFEDLPEEFRFGFH